MALIKKALLYILIPRLIPSNYLINVIVLYLLRVQAVPYQMQVQYLCHAVSVPDDVLQVGVVPGFVAGCEHGQVLHVLHARHKLGIKVVDGLPELGEWSVLLFLFGDASHAHIAK